MDNQIHFEQTPYHHVYLKDRKTLELTGIKKIESFDSLEFLIETSLGYLNIKGSDLALVRFDQERKKRSVLKEILMRFLTYRIKEQQRVKIVF